MGRPRVRAVRVWGITLWVAYAVGCATNPVTGKRQLVLISEAQEVAIGRERQAGGAVQGAPTPEDIDELPGGVEAQDLVGPVARHIEVAVGTEREPIRSTEPSGARRDELTEIVARGVVPHDVVGVVAADVEATVGADDRIVGSIDLPTRGREGRDQGPRLSYLQERGQAPCRRRFGRALLHP